MSGQWMQWLFNPSGFTPHGFCLLWQPWLIWLHAVSDAGIGLAYFTIPLALHRILRRRPDLEYWPVFAVLAAVTVMCGIGHWMDVLTLWVPAYGAAGLVKLGTFAAAASMSCAVWTLMPEAMALPSPAQLRQVNADLREVRRSELRLSAAATQLASARDALTHELTRRQAAEARTQESEERLRTVLQSPVTEALYLLDPAGQIETWNAAAERIKGYTAEEIIGRNFAVFFTQEDAAAGAPGRLLATVQEQGQYTAEATRVCKDGTRFLARISMAAVRRQDGSLRGFVQVTQDITGQRIADEQRAIIIDAAPNGMMIVDESGTITLANAQCARIFGYPPGALTGQSVEILVPDAVRSRHAAMRSGFTGGDGMRGIATGRVFMGRKQNGTDVPVEILLTPVTTPRGYIVVASIFDITERQRLEAERLAAELHERHAVEETNAWLDHLSHDLAQARDRAESANQAKSRFLASVTHELRTPLHGILGYAELMYLEGGLTPTDLQRLEVMIAAGQHLLAMVNSVLDMSQIEADQMELHPVPTDLRQLVGVCLDVVRPAAEAKGLTLIHTVSAPMRVVVDATRLRQVLINLLGNSVKFTPAGGVEVRLHSTQSGSGFRLQVVDTGPGVRAMHRDKLFQTFERLNAEAVSGIEGTGLGLAIAARLIRLMGGRIGYDDNPGGGSIFWLELPACNDTGQSPAAAALPPPAPTRYLRVLVADDEPLNRSIAREFLQRAGHDVVCVNDGAAAVAAASDDTFDVILMDVRMPGMNGLEATRLIRLLPAPRGTACVVAVTAQAFAQQIETCRQAGMDLHLSKPFTEAVLLATLATALRCDKAGSPALLVFDQAAFEGVAEFLPAPDVAGYLQALDTRCAEVAQRLALDAPLAGDLSLLENVHRLAGTAGSLGFNQIAAAACAFEAAAEMEPAALAARSDELAIAIGAAMPAMRRQTLEG